VISPVQHVVNMKRIVLLVNKDSINRVIYVFKHVKKVIMLILSIKLVMYVMPIVLYVRVLLLQNV
jgi:hypothetical protein